MAAIATFHCVFEHMKRYLGLGIVFLIGLGLGFAGQGLIKEQVNQEVRLRQTQYDLINPLLECESAAFENAEGLGGLESELDKLIQDSIAQGKTTQVSVYYRDLNNGPWIGIGEKAEFAPASLVKVPLMMALFKQTETDASILDKPVTIPASVEYADINIIPEATLSAGQTYPVSKLIEQMITQSDNNAYDLLVGVVEPSVLERVYQDLYLGKTLSLSEQGEENIITVKDYAGFFRVLYNSSYVSQRYSQQALELLTKTQFKGGLVAQLPDGVKVAHKFGERNFTFSGLKQLHDCGVVYAKTSPYLLCVMTKGDDFEQLEGVIQAVSKMVYQAHTKTD